MEKHESILIHPGEILGEDVISPPGLSITEAASLLAVSRLTLSKIINGHGGITPNIALRIEKVFGDSADFWLRLQRKYELDKESINFKQNPPELGAYAS